MRKILIVLFYILIASSLYSAPTPTPTPMTFSKEITVGNKTLIVEYKYNNRGFTWYGGFQQVVTPTPIPTRIGQTPTSTPTCTTTCTPTPRHP